MHEREARMKRRSMKNGGDESLLEKEKDLNCMNDEMDFNCAEKEVPSGEMDLKSEIAPFKSTGCSRICRWARKDFLRPNCLELGLQ